MHDFQFILTHRRQIWSSLFNIVKHMSYMLLFIRSYGLYRVSCYNLWINRDT